MRIPVLHSLLLSLGLLLPSILTTCRATNGERDELSTEDRQPDHVRQRDLWQPQARVVGGYDAPSGEFPNFVELSNGCGGALIHADLVLTAGTWENCRRQLLLPCSAH
jgi:Trypsin